MKKGLGRHELSVFLCIWVVVLKSSSAVLLLPLLLLTKCPVVNQELNHIILLLLRSQESVFSDPSDCVSRTRQPVLTNSHNFSVDIRMPGVVPAGVSLCFSFDFKSSSLELEPSVS